MSKTAPKPIDPVPCGHRNCSLCQHNTTQDWLNRQQMKLLPVEYYMVTFTLPAELRPLTFHHHQQQVFDAMFSVSQSLLKDFAKRKKNLQADISFYIGITHPWEATAISPTHSCGDTRWRFQCRS
ncbi:transposase zinc-binding domain-containing protein [Shewanella sp. 202IG2-18]|nr:transposase zinc-binding domain-containing protein [Parashewanella hymeniacidonis]